MRNNSNILSKETLIELIEQNGGTDLILADKMILYLTVPFLNEEEVNEELIYAIGTIVVEVWEGVVEIPYFSIDADGLLHLDAKQTRLISKARLEEIKQDYESDLIILNRLIVRTK